MSFVIINRGTKVPFFPHELESVLKNSILLKLAGDAHTGLGTSS